jgi:hypothetical protein
VVIEDWILLHIVEADDASEILKKGGYEVNSL